MADANEKKGWLSKLFGPKKGCCCNVKIEEVEETASNQNPAEDSQRTCCSEAPTSAKEEQPRFGR